MQPSLENLAGVALSPEAVLVLQRIFARYKRINIVREFSAGLSGSRVLEVRPIKADGTPELPTVVKLATLSMIQREWRAYQQHIQNRLPHVAVVNRRPTLIAAAGWGGLRYPLLGAGDHDIVSLGDFMRHPGVGVEQLQKLLERLLRIMDNVWGYHHPAGVAAQQPSYELALPPGLVLAASAPHSAPTLIAAGQPLDVEPQPGESVALGGFVVQKVDPERGTVTLAAPPGVATGLRSVRVRLPADAPPPTLGAGTVVARLDGTLIETRDGRLRREAAALFPALDLHAPTLALGAGVTLPNPLVALSALLDWSRPANIATIHGDFNLENILVATQLEDVGLIDFAEARQDHALHDLLRLESAILATILPEIVEGCGLDPLRTLLELGWRLHRAMQSPASEQGMPTHEELQKPWVALRAIRRAARRYLFDPGDLREYYQGLCLHLLGSLRFRALERPPAQLPKRMAFMAAAIALQWLLQPDAAPPAPPHRGAPWAGEPAANGRHAPPPAVAQQLDGPRLAVLARAAIPPPGALPRGSRMLLERNRRFVGRTAQIRQLLQGFARDPRRVVAITGLGGIGKSQLACEFAYRYSSLFTGGIFWLSCADPQAVASEVAACGASGAMALRPTFGELPLAEQVALVEAEWRRPAPRLVIFDNCEEPALLERWLPQGGGCLALVTSRRADWEQQLGIASLALPVLARAESLVLLREHQPDAETPALDAIAHELGDLPLALHLAGSYLSRYRHSVDPAGYLASLREASPLAHSSLTAGVHSPTEHDSHVARTFAVSYNQLAGDEPLLRLARAILHGAACLAPGEPIPEELARLALDAGEADAADVAAAGFQLGSALSQLIALGLVHAEAERAIWLHRLVAAFVHDQLGARLPTVQAAAEQALCAEAERLNGLRDPARLRASQLHLRFVAENAAPRGDAPAADVAHALAEHLYQSGDYPAAQGWQQRALGVRRALFGDQHPATAASLTQLGKVLLVYGNIANARPYLEEALAIQRAALGDHNDTATTLNHLGYMHQQLDELDAAQRCHEEALRIRSTLLGPDHPTVVDSLSNLGYVEFRQGKLDVAQALLQQALKLQRLATGNEHPETARLMTNLGELFIARRNASAAAEVLGPSLVIQQRELGLEHPETARTLLVLGDVQRLLGDLLNARQYYEQALEIFRRCHGEEHKRTRWAQRQLDTIHSSLSAS